MVGVMLPHGCLSSGVVAGCGVAVGSISSHPQGACRLPEWKYLLQLSISFCGLLLKPQWRRFRVVWGWLLVGFFVLLEGDCSGFPELLAGFA